MKYSDTYLTINAPSEGRYKEKGSKFLGYAFPVSNEQQIKEIILKLKKEHHSARHHCFAWRLGSDHNLYRLNDDGEPSGTAGKPIFGQIQLYQLTDILVVVVRYFGGVLLGTSGLTNAYKQAANDAIVQSAIIEKIILNNIEVEFNYLAMNDLMLVLKEFALEIKESNFDIACWVKIRVRRDLTQIVLAKLQKTGTLNARITDDN